MDEPTSDYLFSTPTGRQLVGADTLDDAWEQVLDGNEDGNPGDFTLLTIDGEKVEEE